MNPEMVTFLSFRRRAKFLRSRIVIVQQQKVTIVVVDDITDITDIVTTIAMAEDLAKFVTKKLYFTSVRFIYCWELFAYLFR